MSGTYENQPVGFGKMSPERRSEVGRLGGLASAERRRRRRELREAVKFFLGLSVKDPKVREAMAQNGIELSDADYQMAIVVSMARRALEGDTRAAKMLFDLAEQEEGREGEVRIIDDL